MIEQDKLIEEIKGVLKSKGFKKITKDGQRILGN